jgi:hypothetical protein
MRDSKQKIFEVLFSDGQVIFMDIKQFKLWIDRYVPSETRVTIHNLSEIEMESDD